MKKRNIFLLLLGLITITFCLAPKNIQATETTYTVSEYKHFLQTNYPEHLSEFEQLSQQQQQEVVDKILDPNTYQESNFIETERRVQLRAATATRSVWGRSGVYVGNFAILEYEVGGTYASNGSRATKIYSSYAIITRNLNPLTQTTNISKGAWIQNGNFNLQAKFDYKTGPLKGLSIQIGVINAVFTSNGYGTVTQNYWYAQ